MRTYFHTTFNAPVFAALWALDPEGVTAEADARGVNSGLAARVRAVSAPVAAPKAAPAKPAKAAKAKPAKAARQPARLSDGTLVSAAATAAWKRDEGSYRTLKGDIARLEVLHTAHLAAAALAAAASVKATAKA